MQLFSFSLILHSLQVIASLHSTMTVDPVKITTSSSVNEDKVSNSPAVCVYQFIWLSLLSPLLLCLTCSLLLKKKKKLSNLFRRDLKLLFFFYLVCRFIIFQCFFFCIPCFFFLLFSFQY